MAPNESGNVFFGLMCLSPVPLTNIRGLTVQIKWMCAAVLDPADSLFVNQFSKS
jgi:hypothetical protein